jgi:hypothetical protein
MIPQGGLAAAHAVCKNWQQFGSCRFGDSCNFKDGHTGAPGGDSSMVGHYSFRAPMPLVAGRSIVCNNWERDRPCQFGDAGMYKEGHELRASVVEEVLLPLGRLWRMSPTAAAPHRGAVVCNNW